MQPILAIVDLTTRIAYFFAIIVYNRA